MSRNYREPEFEAFLSCCKSLDALGPKCIMLLTSACLVMCLCVQTNFAKPRHRIPKGVNAEDRKRRPSETNLTKQYSLDQKVSDADGYQIRQRLQRIVTRPAVRLFLGVIKKAEAGQPNLMVGGCRAANLRQHPADTLPKRCRYPLRINGHRSFSTASGNYQLTRSNWKRIAPFLGLRNFSENNQAIAALELIRRGGGAAGAATHRAITLKKRIQTGFTELLKGNVKKALCLATYDWASSRCSSLPAGHKVDYTRLLGSVASKQFKY